MSFLQKIKGAAALSAEAEGRSARRSRSLFSWIYVFKVSLSKHEDEFLLYLGPFEDGLGPGFFLSHEGQI